MWQEAVQPYIDDGSLAVIGVVQEQHPARARLYAQWRQLDWPIYVDALNLLDHRVVPIPMLLDASGVIRAKPRRPDQLAAFMAEEFPESARLEPLPADPAVLRAAAEEAGDGRSAGDACFLAGDLDAAAAAYGQADAEDARAIFRLGVVHKRRAEGSGAQEGDEQTAIDAWTRALALQPNQYIWRRRLQQYGPRLHKPYNFYFWITEARDAIRARGEEPLPLPVEPEGSEISPPGEGSASLPDPDPDARVTRDAGLVTVRTLITPGKVRPGRAVRVRLRMSLDGAWWNNETTGLRIAGRLPPGFGLLEARPLSPPPDEAESQEERLWELELRLPGDQPPGEVTLPLYLLYDVCEDAGGVCLHLRQELPLTIVVDPQAASVE